MTHYELRLEYTREESQRASRMLRHNKSQIIIFLLVGLFSLAFQVWIYSTRYYSYFSVEIISLMPTIMLFLTVIGFGVVLQKDEKSAKNWRAALTKVKLESI